MPLIRRIPKRGFKSRNRVEYQIVNVRDLDRVEGEITPESLRAAGLIRSLRKPVKVLGVGEVSAKLAVTAHKFSASARAKIESAGGTVTELAPAPGSDDAPAEEAPVEAAAATEEVVADAEPEEVAQPEASAAADAEEAVESESVEADESADDDPASSEEE